MKSITNKSIVVTQNMGGHIVCSEEKYVEYTDSSYQNALSYDKTALKSLYSATPIKQ